MIEGVPVILYDTPGLGDSRAVEDEAYLKMINKLMEKESIHLIIYCFKMNGMNLECVMEPSAPFSNTQRLESIGAIR